MVEEAIKAWPIRTARSEADPESQQTRSYINHVVAGTLGLDPVECIRWIPGACDSALPRGLLMLSTRLVLGSFGNLLLRTSTRLRYLSGFGARENDTPLDLFVNTPTSPLEIHYESPSSLQ